VGADAAAGKAAAAPAPMRPAMSLVARTLQRAQSHREWPQAAQAKACALRLRDYWAPA